MSSFRFVYIPADATQPLQELTQEVEPGKEVECLTNRLQQHFREQSASSAAIPKDARKQMLEQHMKGVVVTDEMLNAVGDMQMVENVTLLSGNAENGFTHVNLYVDDTGSLKSLPDNVRAAGLAAAAGHPCEVHGDAFVGRTIDCDDAFERLDFTLAEVSSTAPWIAEAQARNARRRENSAKLPGLMPSGTQVVTGMDGGASAARAQAEADATQRGVEGKPYTFSQDDEEVVLELRVPAATKAADVSCTLKPGSLKLAVRTLGEGQTEVLDGDLFGRVRADESSWNLCSVGGERVVQLTLSKQAPGRWASILKE